MKFWFQWLIGLACLVPGAGWTKPTITPGSGVAAQAAAVRPFSEVVNQYFDLWDADKDGVLSEDEMNAAVTNPAFKDEAAAAMAAIKVVVRGGKYHLPAITRDYLVASPLHEVKRPAELAMAEAGRAQTNKLDHPPAFQPRYRNFVGRLRKTSRELFPQVMPALDACHQGPLGDCYFVSVVGGMLHRNPEAIRSLFTTNADGSTTVTFANGKTFRIDPLTDAEIAIASSTGTNGLWLAVLENAYGRLRSKEPADEPAEVPEIDAISHGGKPEPVIKSLDGFQTQSRGLRSRNATNNPAQLLSEVRQDLEIARQNDRLAEATTPASGELPPGINAKHAYAIIGYNRDTGRVRLWNPHGNNFKPKGPEGLKFGYLTRAGQFDMPLQDLLKVYQRVILETAVPVEKPVD